jgi:hypothetical protein
MCERHAECDIGGVYFASCDDQTLHILSLIPLYCCRPCDCLYSCTQEFYSLRGQLFPPGAGMAWNERMVELCLSLIALEFVTVR